MWFLVLVEHFLLYLKLNKTSSIKVDIRQYSKHRIWKSTGKPDHVFPRLPSGDNFKNNGIHMKKKHFLLSFREVYSKSGDFCFDSTGTFFKFCLSFSNFVLLFLFWSFVFRVFKDGR